jgi:hypothetical protein
VFAADEYYLLAARPFPAAAAYEGFPQHENGVGMARAFEEELLGSDRPGLGVKSGFFHAVDGAPADGYRAPRHDGDGADAGVIGDAPVGILTGEYGARVLSPLLTRLRRDDVRLVPVANRFFGGNIAVTGLLVGEDVAAALAAQPEGHRYLLPDVCLSQGRFLDGLTPDALPRPVEVVATDGHALRAALGPSGV